MRIVPVLFLSVGLAACSSSAPRVIDSTPDGVSVSFSGSEADLKEATETARRECGRTGRMPVLLDVSRVEDRHVATFECRRSGA